ncbi:MAG: hypothetical protein VKJ02_00750 [Snowella sp.]|nr:hypothetical protein [Snowella sp.]
MLTLIKPFLTRFLSVLLLQIVLILGLFFGNYVPAIADDASSKPYYLIQDNPSSSKPYYLNRKNFKKSHTQQSQKSSSAKAKEEPETFTETLVEKLNLHEPRPESAKKVIDQIKGNLPIEDTTHPDANY